MKIDSNTDINNLKFLNDDTSLTIDNNYLNKLKKIAKGDIDIDCFNLIKNEINDNKLRFKITPQEKNYLKNIPESMALEYIIYRYKFKEFPKKKISTDFPIYILIEPVSSCNLKCPMCFQSDKSFIKKEYMGKMNFELYKKIIDEASVNGTKAITFGSRGEPTIHPEFKSFLDYCSNKFLDIKLITNATKLNDDLIHTVFKNKIHQVVFSIDSEEKNAYERIRKFGNYDQVLNNVKRYNEIKKEYKNINTITRISGVKVEEEQDEKKFCDFWKPYADEVVMKPAFSRWDTYNNNVINDFLEPCSYIWERMYIWFDGKVNPCDADYKSFLSYGNVKDSSIKEIWNSKKYKDLQKKHLIKERNKITPCDRCGIS